VEEGGGVGGDAALGEEEAIEAAEGGEVAGDGAGGEAGSSRKIVEVGAEGGLIAEAGDVVFLAVSGEVF